MTSQFSQALRKETEISTATETWRRENTAPFYNYFSGGRSRKLIKIDENGNELVLYDAGPSFNARLIATCCLCGFIVVGSPLIILTALFRSLRKRRVNGEAISKG